MTFIHNFYLSNFIIKLSVLSHHAKHPKKTSAVLRITAFLHFFICYSTL